MEPREMDDREQTGPDEAPADADPAPAAGPRCPWCSAPQASNATRCESCGANLAADDDSGDRVIVGVTTVDPGMIEHDQWLRSRHVKKRPGLFAALLGRTEEVAAPPPTMPRTAAPTISAPAIPMASPEEVAAIAPPSDDVKREMARLARDAAIARATAEAEARMIEARIEQMDAAAARQPAVAAAEPAATEPAAEPTADAPEPTLAPPPATERPE